MRFFPVDTATCQISLRWRVKGMKLLNETIFYIMKKYTRLYGKSFIFWFLGTRFGPEYLLKMNIIVNISDLRLCSHC